MDNFNKIISFVLGLVVVIVFLIVIGGRFNLKERVKDFGSQKKLSPTPTIIIGQYSSPTPSAIKASGQGTTNTYTSSQKTPTTIPTTGFPTLLLPALFSTLYLGIYLKKKNK